MEREEQTGETKKEGGATAQTPNPTKDHIDEAVRSVKQIPKQEELKGFSFEKLFAGRLDKKNYLYGIIVGVIAGFILTMIPIIGWIISLGLCVVGIAATARRFRDINLSGWWAILGILGPVGLIVALYLVVAEPVNEGNQFGAAPDANRPFFYAILNL